MEHSQLWTIIGLLLTNAGFLFGMWKYFDARITRVYERFDAHKEELGNTFVRKDSCALLHNNTADNLKNVETRMNTRFDKLEVKVETAFQMIIDLLKK